MAVAACSFGLGASFPNAENGKYIRFPAAGNINLKKGAFKFWYRPNYDAGADDVTRTLVIVGQVYDAPRMVLQEADTLSFGVE